MDNFRTRADRFNGDAGIYYFLAGGGDRIKRYGIVGLLRRRHRGTGGRAEQLDLAPALLASLGVAPAG